ncbi:MAG: hypothetical protein ABL864_10455 [Terricaulis sp.]
MTPHVGAKAKHSALDERANGHATYRLSQIIRKRIEGPFGWIPHALTTTDARPCDNVTSNC